MTELEFLKLIMIVNIALQIVVILSMLLTLVGKRLGIDWLTEFRKPHRKYGFEVFWFEQPTDYYAGVNVGKRIFKVVFNPWIAREDGSA